MSDAKKKLKDLTIVAGGQVTRVKNLINNLGSDKKEFSSDHKVISKSLLFLKSRIGKLLKGRNN